MGMYTELHINGYFKKDTPVEIIDTLKLLSNPDLNYYDITKYQLPEHPFFYSKRWFNLLFGASVYFDESYCEFSYDKNKNQWQLHSKSNIKNYDDEIENFIHFIFPYLEPAYEMKWDSE